MRYLKDSVFYKTSWTKAIETYSVSDCRCQCIHGKLKFKHLQLQGGKCKLLQNNYKSYNQRWQRNTHLEEIYKTSSFVRQESLKLHIKTWLLNAISGLITEKFTNKVTCLFKTSISRNVIFITSKRKYSTNKLATLASAWKIQLIQIRNVSDKKRKRQSALN